MNCFKCKKPVKVAFCAVCFKALERKLKEKEREINRLKQNIEKSRLFYNKIKQLSQENLEI